MCPLWPFHYLFMYVITLGPLWFLSFRVVGTAASVVTTKWNVVFEPDPIKSLKVGDNVTVQTRFNKTELYENYSEGKADDEIEILVDDPFIASVSPSRFKLTDFNNNTEEKLKYDLRNSSIDDDEYFASFNVTGQFLGKTKLRIRRMVTKENNENVTLVSDGIDVSVIRAPRTMDKVFTYSVAALVAIICINMGAAVDMPTIKKTMKTPIGPLIGLFSQFVIMPLLSFGLAKLLIPLPGLQLGLFLTGCSPGGGASNIWTLTLGGNLDLSITMTTISTLSAFAMMPFWMLTLGSTIFADAKLKVPYSKIATFAVALLVPLAIGIAIQKCAPKLAVFLKKILKPFAVFLIVFIVVFAVYTNLYLFKLFTWSILLSGMLLPWLGYILGGGLALLLKQDWRDVVAISVETGVQNTGLAIFALRFSLPQPEADLTTVIPVAVALMTPVLPTLVFLFQKIRRRSNKGFTIQSKEEPLTPII